MYAVNLASLCPFSLSSLIAYQKYEWPHVHPPARRATSAKQTDTAVESTQHFTVPRGTGLSSESRRESATESVWNLRVPVNGASGKFSPILHYADFFIDALLSVDE